MTSMIASSWPSGFGPGNLSSRRQAENSHLGSLSQQLVQGGDQRIDPRGGDLPHQRIVNGRVAVNKDIAEGDDPGQVGHSVSGCEIDAAEPVEGFADDLELPFYGRLQHRIVLVVLEGSPADEVEGGARPPGARATAALAFQAA